MKTIKDTLNITTQQEADVMGTQTENQGKATQKNRLEIRRAWTDDLDRLMKWRMEVLRDVFAPLYPALEPVLEANNRRYMRQGLENGTFEGCFAVLDGNIVGCGAICYQQEMPSPDNHTGHSAYLMNIYVCPEYRGLTIGSTITSWLVAQAKAHYCGKIYLESSDKGRSVYEGLGFQPMTDMMTLG